MEVREKLEEMKQLCLKHPGTFEPGWIERALNIMPQVIYNHLICLSTLEAILDIPYKFENTNTWNGALSEVYDVMDRKIPNKEVLGV